MTVFKGNVYRNNNSPCPTKRIGVDSNSFKRVRALQIELEFGSVGFEERGKPEYPEKNLSEQRGEATANS